MLHNPSLLALVLKDTLTATTLKKHGEADSL